MRFKVGDKVRINEKEREYNKYAITQTGSEGIITKKWNERHYDVKFTKTTGEEGYTGEFPIDAEYLEFFDIERQLKDGDITAERYIELKKEELLKCSK